MKFVRIGWAAVGGLIAFASVYLAYVARSGQ